MLIPTGFLCFSGHTHRLQVAWVMVWQHSAGCLWHSPALGKGEGCQRLCWPCPAAGPWSVLPKQELHWCSVSLYRLLLLRCRAAFPKARPSLQPRDSCKGGALGHQCSGSSRAAPSSLVCKGGWYLAFWWLLCPITNILTWELQSAVCTNLTAQRDTASAAPFGSKGSEHPRQP